MDAIVGVDGLAWAQPVADILSLLLVVVLVIVAMKKHGMLQSDKEKVK